MDTLARWCSTIDATVISLAAESAERINRFPKQWALARIFNLEPFWYTPGKQWRTPAPPQAGGEGVRELAESINPHLIFLSRPQLLVLVFPPSNHWHQSVTKLGANCRRWSLLWLFLRVKHDTHMPILWLQEVFQNASSSKCTFFLANEKMPC